MIRSARTKRGAGVTAGPSRAAAHNVGGSAKIATRSATKAAAPNAGGPGWKSSKALPPPPPGRTRREMTTPLDRGIRQKKAQPSSAATKRNRKKKEKKKAKKKAKKMSGEEMACLRLAIEYNHVAQLGCDSSHVGEPPYEGPESDAWDRLQELSAEDLKREAEQAKGSIRQEVMLPGKESFLWLAYNWEDQPHAPTPGREDIKVDLDTDSFIIAFPDKKEPLRKKPVQELIPIKVFRDEFKGQPGRERDHEERQHMVHACISRAGLRKTNGLKPDVYWPLGSGANDDGPAPFPRGDLYRLSARSSGRYYCVQDAFFNALVAAGCQPPSKYLALLHAKLNGYCEVQQLIDFLGGCFRCFDTGSLYSLRPLKKASWYDLTRKGSDLRGIFLVSGWAHTVAVDTKNGLLLNAASHFALALTQQNLVACRIFDGPVSVYRLVAKQAPAQPASV